MEDNKLDKKLDKIEEHLGNIDEKLGNIDVTLVKQASELEHHIYRTSLAEQHLKILEAKIEPLTDFHVKASGIMKFVGVIATALTIVIGIVKLVTELL